MAVQYAIGTGPIVRGAFRPVTLRRVALVARGVANRRGTSGGADRVHVSRASGEANKLDVKEHGEKAGEDARGGAPHPR